MEEEAEKLWKDNLMQYGRNMRLDSIIIRSIIEFAQKQSTKKDEQINKLEKRLEEANNSFIKNT